MTKAETDYHTATVEQLTALGFHRWDKESGIYLCPLARFEELPDGIALHSIGGEVKVKGRDYIDDDTRGGLLAYGIIPGKTHTDVSAAEVATREAARRAEFAATILEVTAQSGVLDLSSGRMLHGDEADRAMRQTLGLSAGGE